MEERLWRDIYQRVKPRYEKEREVPRDTSPLFVTMQLTQQLQIISLAAS